jgi:hypothetical protein
MIPWLEEPVVDIGNHRVHAVMLLQDGSSLIGLVIVAGFVLYGLRRGREQAVAQRLLNAAERRAWVLTYVAAAIGLSVAWLLWEPTSHSVKAIATGIAVGALRGAATSLVCISVALDWRLRALHMSTARSLP